MAYPVIAPGQIQPAFPQSFPEIPPVPQNDIWVYRIIVIGLFVLLAAAYWFNATKSATQSIIPTDFLVGVIGMVIVFYYKKEQKV